MSAQAVRYCEQCGQEREAGTGIGGHRCVGNAELEPPRYCGRCRRRMVVQITPSGWSARCSEHGTITADDQTSDSL